MVLLVSLSHMLLFRLSQIIDLLMFLAFADEKMEITKSGAEDAEVSNNVPFG